MFSKGSFVLNTTFQPSDGNIAGIRDFFAINRIVDNTPPVPFRDFNFLKSKFLLALKDDVREAQHLWNESFVLTKWYGGKLVKMVSEQKLYKRYVGLDELIAVLELSLEHHVNFLPPILWSNNPSLKTWYIQDAPFINKIRIFKAAILCPSPYLLRALWFAVPGIQGWYTCQATLRNKMIALDELFNTFVNLLALGQLDICHAMWENEVLQRLVKNLTPASYQRLEHVIVKVRQDKKVTQAYTVQWLEEVLRLGALCPSLKDFSFYAKENTGNCTDLEVDMILERPQPSGNIPLITPKFVHRL
jgi:hypothetical protein